MGEFGLSYKAVTGAELEVVTVSSPLTSPGLCVVYYVLSSWYLFKNPVN